MAFENCGTVSHLSKCFRAKLLPSGKLPFGFILDISVSQKEGHSIQKGPVCVFHLFQVAASVLLLN